MRCDIVLHLNLIPEIIYLVDDYDPYRRDNEMTLGFAKISMQWLDSNFFQEKSQRWSLRQWDAISTIEWSNHILNLPQIFGK
jgi:hypothetical protein